MLVLLPMAWLALASLFNGPKKITAQTPATQS
jgi:hypothetical protein